MADDAALYRSDFFADLSPVHEPEASLYYDFQADLADPDVRYRFFAVEALRHVVATFKRDLIIQAISSIIGDCRHYSEHDWMAL